MKLKCKKQLIEVVQFEPFVSGTVGEYRAEFTFDARWDGYTKFAVFQIISRKTYQIALDAEDSCTIPWEVFEKQQYIMIGVYGIKDTNRYPTIWTKPLTVEPGAANGEGGDPTPVISVAWESILNKPFETLGGSLASVNGVLQSVSYIHNQGSPESEWHITHNFNKFPSVTVVDSAGNTVIGEVQYLSENDLKVTFQAAFSGKAYLN